MKGFDRSARRELEARTRAACVRAAATGLPQVAWVVLAPDGVDPLAAFAAAPETERFFFEGPEGGSFAALGAAYVLDGVGAGRLADVAREAAALRGEAPPGGLPLAGPIMAGGFAFQASPSGPAWEGFPAARFVLPGLLLASAGGRTRLTVSLVATPGAESAALSAGAVRAVDRLRRALESGTASAPVFPEGPAIFGARADQPHARYRLTVRRALESIREGTVEKVVVARSCTVSRPGGFDAARMLAALRAAHPACFRFARASGHATFLGATPERLVRREGRRVSTSALAGSAPRGRTPAEDERLGAALRLSKKEQQEHAVVVRALRAALAPCCEEIEAPESPALLRLEGIQHLHTPVTARLREGEDASLLDLAARLHPSPAVAGAPRQRALAWLRRNEGLDRGWYAGAVGWMRPDGDGELAVALRTALLRGDDAVLHAGAGVVEGSTPEGELAETRLKLRAGLSALLEI